MVVGLAPEKFNHQYLTKAFCLIKEKKAPLIAIHKGWGNLRIWSNAQKMNQITVPKLILGIIHKGRFLKGVGKWVHKKGDLLNKVIYSVLSIKRTGCLTIPNVLIYITLYI